MNREIVRAIVGALVIGAAVLAVAFLNDEAITSTWIAGAVGAASLTFVFDYRRLRKKQTSEAVTT